MKKIVLGLIAVISLSLAASAQDGNRIVADLDKPEELLIAPGSLYAYNRFIFRENTAEKFEQMQVIQQKDSYFLLCQGSETGHILAFELMEEKNKLYLPQEASLHVCTEGAVSATAFIWDEDAITACSKGEYKKY